MSKHADARADQSKATIPVRELNEAELSITTGGSSGGGAGKVRHTEFSVTKTMDQASSKLF